MAKEKDVKKKDNNLKNVKKKDNKKEKSVKKESFFASVKKELKLVKWPTAKDIIKYTIATIIFCVIFVLFFELLNLIMAYVKGLLN